MRRVSLLLLAIALGAALAPLAACSREAACASDLDCTAQEACVEGACQPLDLGGAAKGTCAQDSDCSAGEVCIEGRCWEPGGEVSCASEFDSLCLADGLACGLDPDEPTCEAGAPCEVRLACLPPAGTKVGAERCAADTECRSGTCVEGACLRPCRSDGACPPTFACAPRTLADGRSISTCIGEEDGAANGDRTLCRRAADCAEGRTCRFLVGSPYLDEGDAFPVCEVEEPTRKPTPHACFDFDHASCAGNVCRRACQSWEIDICGVTRCTEPCETSEDCPPRMRCEFQINSAQIEGRPVKFCQFPPGSCADELDCCPARDSQGLCVRGWSPGETHCQLRAEDGRPMSFCEEQREGRRPGELCSAHADCTSLLCLPAPAGFVPPDGGVEPAGGFRICSSVCDPDPAMDRCAVSVHPRTTCRELPWELEGHTFTLRACQ